MEIEKTALDGVLILTPRRFGDARGFFSESWNKARMEEAGLHYDFVQDNHSVSAQVGTLRGLHFQAPPDAQDKLVRCVQGAIFDVAVDIRPDSPTYGKWEGVILSAENHHQLLVPKGFAHGFQVIGETAEVMYKCTDFYSPNDERGLLWSDPALNISWPDPQNAILSDKDLKYPLFENIVLD